MRTTGGHIIDPAGMRTSTVGIHSFTYVASFIVLSECSKHVIFGMNFLQASGAVINLQEICVSFSTKHAIATFESEKQFDALQIAGDDVTVPPR